MCFLHCKKSTRGFQNLLLLLLLPPPPSDRRFTFLLNTPSPAPPPPPPPASFCFPVFSPIVEPPEFGSVGGVAKNATTKGKGGRRNEERRQGHSQFTSQEETGGVGGRRREEEQMRSEEGEKEGNGYRGRREGINNAAKKQQQLKSHLDRPKSYTPRHSKCGFFLLFSCSSSFFQRERKS